MKKTLLILTALFLLTGLAFAQTKPGNGDAEFTTFLTKLDAAQVELQNGKAEAFKAIWSKADDVTLSGGFGGTVEKGWASISKRLDWVGANFAKGTNKIDRLVKNHGDKFGYVVQLEHIDFIVPDSGKAATKDYRVTMIFRRERDGWRLIHRQADSQMTKQAPQ